MAAVMEQWSHAGTSFLSLFFLHDYNNIYVYNIYFLHACFILYNLPIFVLHNIVFNVLSDNKNCCCCCYKLLLLQNIIHSFILKHLCLFSVFHDHHFSHILVYMEKMNFCEYLCMAFWSIFMRQNSLHITHANHMTMTTSGQI